MTRHEVKRGGNLFRSAVLVLSLIAMLPTFLVKIPATEDYLDHLGRMYILATSGTPDANPYYQVSWALYPDLAMDIVVPLLGKLIDIETAGWIFFLTAQLLIVSGAVALEFSVKRRHEIAGFAALLTLYSMPFSFGFVNFEFGTGVALWGIAAWIALSRTGKLRLRFGVHFVSVIVIFLSHFFALGIYGLTIGLLELKKILLSPRDARYSSFTLVTLLSPATAMFLLMKLSGASVGEFDNAWWFAWKPVWFALFLNGYNSTLAIGSIAALVTLLVYCGITRSLSPSMDGKWIAIGFLIVFLAMPFKLCGSRMADIRMITAIFLVLPAFINYSPRTQSINYIAGLITSAIILINVGYVGHVWLSYQHDYAAMKASFADVRKGSFILVGARDREETVSTGLAGVPMYRAPALAVYYAKAFVTSLYTIPGTHAVEVKPDLKRLDVNSKSETYAPPSSSILQTIALGGKAPDAPQYIRHWTQDFDYLYLLGPRGPNILPDRLDELVVERRFTLYRVRR